MRRRDEENELGFRVAVAPPLAIILGAGDGDEGSVVDQVQELGPALGDDCPRLRDQRRAEVEVGRRGCLWRWLGGGRLRRGRCGHSSSSRRRRRCERGLRPPEKRQRERCRFAMDGDDRALQPQRSARAAGASRGAEQGHRGRRVRNCERAERSDCFLERTIGDCFFRKRTSNSFVARSLSLGLFSTIAFFPASSLPAFSSLPSNGDAIRSSGSPAARGARPALLCDEGAGKRFVFSRLKSRQGKFQIEVDAASKAAGVISPALEEEGGVIALCSCLLC